MICQEKFEVLPFEKTEEYCVLFWFKRTVPNERPGEKGGRRLSNSKACDRSRKGPVSMAACIKKGGGGWRWGGSPPAASLSLSPDNRLGKSGINLYRTQLRIVHPD